MWFFDWFKNQFYNVYSWLDYAGSVCDDLPAIGTILGYPFHTTAGFFYDLSTAAGYASSWSDDVVNIVNIAYDNALNAFNYAYGALTDYVNSAISAANQAYNYAVNYLADRVDDAISLAQGAYNYARDYVTEQVSNIQQWFSSEIARLDNAFWQTVKDWQTNYDHVISQINEVSTRVLSNLDVIDIIENSLGYFVDRSIELIGGQASRFAEPLWWLFEKIIEQLSQWEG